MQEAEEVPQQPSSNSEQAQASEARDQSLRERTADFFRRHPALKISFPMLTGIPLGAGAVALTGEPLVFLGPFFAGGLSSIFLSAREIVNSYDENVKKDRIANGFPDFDSMPRMTRGEYRAQLVEKEDEE